jgi:peptide/nickel transport system ATP-binding protein
MRRRAQIVFQNPDSSLNPRRTVGEIIARPLRRFAVVPPPRIPARVAALLELVRLPDHYAARYPHQLSGGEKQRVGIARALAPGPDLIVCDEPVSALDVSVQAAIVNLLADLRDRLGLTVLLISHDIGVVAHLADRIAVMYRGGIVQTGTAGDVMGGPWHPYTAALLSAVPSLDGPARPRVRLGPEGPARDGPGCRFAARCPRRIGALCDTTAPPLRTLSATNTAACHLDAADLAQPAAVIPLVI